jgi:CCR4-NOT transcriptional regulation complex NOT5 subunit
MTAKTIMTKAQQDAMALTQQSEKESLDLLLKAYRQDPAFYVYYYRLKSYQQLLSGKDHWVVSSHDDFFKHLANPNVTTPQH